MDLYYLLVWCEDSAQWHEADECEERSLRRAKALLHGRNAFGFPQPSFAPLPADWEKCVGRNTGLVGAFHRHKPGLLEAYPKDRAKASGPWPSIRSWTNAAICAAAMEAIDAEPLLR